MEGWSQQALLNPLSPSIHHTVSGRVTMADDWLTLEVGDIAPEFEAELTDSSIVKLAEILAGG
ncbi:MAG TPA: hypothetical protein D7I15_05420, partial [Candidatus Poseidoniales archaeon]